MKSGQIPPYLLIITLSISSLSGCVTHYRAEAIETKVLVLESKLDQLREDVNTSKQSQNATLEHISTKFEAFQSEIITIIDSMRKGDAEDVGTIDELKELISKQKGELSRLSFELEQLKEKGWPILAIDAGNQVRRFGRQAEVKLQQTVNALKQMDYQAVGFGPDDLRLGVGELLSVAAGETAEDTPYVSSNVVLIDPSLMPQSKLIQVGIHKIGITSVIDPELVSDQTSGEIEIREMVNTANRAASQWRPEQVAFQVLLFYGSEETAKQIATQLTRYSLIVVAGGYGEPTFQPIEIPGSRARMVLTGEKGMYAGLFGLFDRGEHKYARVPLTHQFEDAPEMRQLMKEYQDQLKDIRLKAVTSLLKTMNQ